MGIPARFVLSDVLSLTAKLRGKFDIVYASYGALYWIPNLKRWCETASSYLKKGGFLYVVDGHPFRNWLEHAGPETDISKVKMSYFDRTAKKYEGGTD